MNEDEQVEQPEDELEDETEEEEADETEGEEEETEEADQSVTTDEIAADDNEEEPAAVYLPTGEGPAQARLKEVLDPEVFASVQAYVSEQVARSMQTFGVTQAAFQAAAAAHPDIFRQYGGKIQMALSMFPEHERHTRKSVDIATLLATTEHKAGTPEFARELLKIAQKMNGGPEQKAKAPKAPITADSRHPTPSSAPRAQAVSSKESNIKALQAKYGLDREEAEGMLYEATRKPVRR